MSGRLSGLAPHFPAVLLLITSCGAGTFLSGAQAGWAIAGHVVLLAFVAAMASAWPDPLRWGPAGNVLLAALAVSLAASSMASPVPRAGLLVWILGPALLLVPSAVAHCWETRDQRRIGLRSISLVFSGVAIISLVTAWRFDLPSTSLPLGHHNLLAAWLLVAGPLAVLSWREGGLDRGLAVLALVSGLASFVGTRSLGGALALTAIAVIYAWRYRAVRVALLLACVALAPRVPRLLDVAQGADMSVAARLSYAQAGWEGWSERPMLGWGPGAARWTISEHLRPQPGLHPPDQVVGDFHSLPLEIGYELGWSGLLVLVALGALLLRRRVEMVDAGLRRAALVGVGGLAIMSCSGLPLAVSALPLAAAVALGAVFAAESPRPRSGRGVAIAVAMLGAILVAPLDLAHLAYDRAAASEKPGEQIRALQRAVRFDPAFPLYRARLAWLEAETAEGLEAASSQAHRAAMEASGVAPLWLVAGLLGQDAAQPWRRDALLNACRLSALGAMAPFHLSLEEDPRRAQWGARALLAEPRFLAAVAWREQATLIEGAVDSLVDRDGIDAGWRKALAELSTRLAASEEPMTQRLALIMDGEPGTSASLYSFRRRPWPVYLAAVDLDANLAAQIDLQPAVASASFVPLLLDNQDCTLGASAKTKR